MSLVSLMVGLATSTIVVGVVVGLSMYSTFAFAALCNYVFINNNTQNGLDTAAKEIRQVKRLSSYDSTNLTFIDFDDQPLSYTYNSAAGTLTRSKSGVSQVRLRDLSYCSFTLLQRNFDLGTYDRAVTTNAVVCKAVRITFVSSKPVVGSMKTTEAMQSADFVIRAD